MLLVGWFECQRQKIDLHGRLFFSSPEKLDHYAQAASPADQIKNEKSGSMLDAETWG
jgi:hypothetical protein